MLEVAFPGYFQSAECLKRCKWPRKVKPIERCSGSKLVLMVSNKQTSFTLNHRRPFHSEAVSTAYQVEDYIQLRSIEKPLFHALSNLIEAIVSASIED